MGILKQSLQTLSDASKFPLLVLIVAVVLGVVGNGLYDFLHNARGWPAHVLALGGFTLLLLFALAIRPLPFLRRLLLRFLGRATDPFSYIDKEFAVKRRGLIVTLGFGSHKSGSPLMKELEILRPRFLGFLVTEDIKKIGAVEQIVKSLNMAGNTYEVASISPTDVSDIKNSTLNLIRWMEKNRKVPIRKLAVDITGGTAPMSVGAFLAAQERGVDITYVFSDYDLEANRPKPDTQKALVMKLQ